VDSATTKMTADWQWVPAYQLVSILSICVKKADAALVVLFRFDEYLGSAGSEHWRMDVYPCCAVDGGVWWGRCVGDGVSVVYGTAGGSRRNWERRMGVGR
jgi:hypothetical protein